jgi:Tol biopolymer transport system component
MGRTDYMVSRQAALRLLTGAGVLAALNCGGADVMSPPTTGSLRITSTISGPTPDEDGYTITFDGTARGALGTSGDVSIDGLEPGEHLVGLSGVAGNCEVIGEHPRTVTVTAGQSVTVGFAVTCVTPPPSAGSLRISTTTTGAELDPDGYSYAVDGGSSQLIGINATATLTNVSAASHSIQLSGLAGNCSVAGTNPSSVTVTAGATAEVSFAVTCTATTASIAFASLKSGESFVSTVRPDGTGLTTLSAGIMPVWSPDRRKILFLRITSGSPAHALSVMNADGSNPENLVDDHDVFSDHFHWSPDGQRIAFVTEECLPLDNCKGWVRRLWVMKADGSNRLMLRQGDAGDVAWSPDGRKLAFVNGTGQLNTINADGSSSAVLITDELSQDGGDPPSWSPDGALIAIGGEGPGGERGIYVIRPDGTGMMNLTPGPAFNSHPRWSPDGSKIAFYTIEPYPGGYGLSVVNRDGSGQALLTNKVGGWFDWSPDGTQFVSAGSGGDHSDIYVMNADGTGRTNVTHTPEIDEDFPSWSRH